MITHADDSHGEEGFSSPFVFFRTISEMYPQQSWKPIAFGVKRSKVRSRGTRNLCRSLDITQYCRWLRNRRKSHARLATPGFPRVTRATDRPPVFPCVVFRSQRHKHFRRGSWHSSGCWILLVSRCASSFSVVSSGIPSKDENHEYPRVLCDCLYSTLLLYHSDESFGLLLVGYLRRREHGWNILYTSSRHRYRTVGGSARVCGTMSIVTE